MAVLGGTNKPATHIVSVTNEAGARPEVIAQGRRTFQTTLQQLGPEIAGAEDNRNYNAFSDLRSRNFHLKSCQIRNNALGFFFKLPAHFLPFSSNKMSVEIGELEQSDLEVLTDDGDILTTGFHF